jgi:GT2 family glycosyltransferase
MTLAVTPQISVVIPTYQRRDALARALRALAGQSLPAERFEVIVVVDGSDDGTRELLAAWRAPYRLRSLWQPNRGRGAAINAGTRLAGGDLLILLDDDMEPSPGLVAAHAQAHRSEPRLGIMGAAPIELRAGLPPLVASYIGPKFNRHLDQLARPDHALVLRDFYSGNFSVRRTALLETGGFDEDFRIYGNEDLELSIRLVRAGVRLGYCAEALAVQHYSKNFAALAHDTMAKGRTAVLLGSKHPETLADLQLSRYEQAAPAWRALRSLLLWLSRPGSAIPAAVAATIRALEPLAAGRSLHYRLSLDYFYWAGAQAALRENRRTGRGLGQLPRLAHR